MSDAIDEVRWWFEAGGYEVTERVGRGAGEVDRFAVQRRGIRPPTVWWTVAERFPADLDAALDELEAGRQTRGADQALAVVTGEDSPAEHRPDLAGRASNYVSLRYLALELSGVLEEQRELAARTLPLPLIRRPFQDDALREVDGHDLVEQWVESGGTDPLVLVTDPGFAVDELIHEVVSLRLERCLQAPERHVPISMQLAESDERRPIKRLLARRWVVAAEDYEEDLHGLRLLRVGRDAFKQGHRWLRATPGATAVMEWLRAVAPQRAVEQLRATFVGDAASRRALLWKGARSAMHDALQQDSDGDPSLWATSVLSSWISGTVTRGFEEADQPSDWTELEDAALYAFAIDDPDGGAPLSEYVAERLEPIELLAFRGDGRSNDRYAFTSPLVRDWFLARKIAREVRAGNREILARYVFPRVHVGLFLAVTAPDVASLLMADRSEALRREVEGEVARKVQLTLGHQLNRSIGALGAHVRTVRRAFRDEALDDRARAAFARIDEELDHLRRLTERSRLLDDAASPWELVAVALAESVAAVAEPLRLRHPEVALDLDVPDGLAVQATRDALREVIHCVLENAYHSTAALPEGRPRRVSVRAAREGETVWLRVRDNGGGVRPEDHERIFQPFVTTKTGGAGAPRGTGLGLSIARTFAERMGAKVSLEASNGETVFAMVFVAGR